MDRNTPDPDWVTLNAELAHQVNAQAERDLALPAWFWPVAVVVFLLTIAASAVWPMGVATAAAMLPAWLPERRDMCVTGGSSQQPFVSTGELRDHRWFASCGSLDAPDYIPMGGASGYSVPFAGDGVINGYVASVPRVRGGIGAPR
jgi:hypothetical protein